jgi:hypothetical protein
MEQVGRLVLIAEDTTPWTAEPKTFALHVGENTVGRGRENSVWLDYPIVSTDHAVIDYIKDDDRYCVKDLLVRYFRLVMAVVRTAERSTRSQPRACRVQTGPS